MHQQTSFVTTFVDQLHRAEVKHRVFASFSGNPAAMKVAIDPLDCGKLPLFFESCSEQGWPPIKLSELFAEVFRCDFAIEATGGFLSLEFCWDQAHKKVRTAATQQVREWCCPEGTSIVLLGPDGVGKSTFAWALAHALRPVFPVHRIFQWRPQVLKPRPGTPPGVFNSPHSDPAHGTLESIARLGAVLLDYWTAQYFIIKPLQAQSGVVIWDRSFHDLVVDYKRYRYGGPMWVARRAAKLLPGREWIFLVLEAEEKTILARKQEVEAEELHRQWGEYHQLAVELPNARIVRTDQCMEVAVAEGVSATVSYLKARFRSRYRRDNLDRQEAGEGPAPANISKLQFSSLFDHKPSRADARRWAGRALLVVIDQGLISGSNFALGILLARWLGAAEYGAYALAFATFLLLSLVYHAIVLEPMSVFGGSKYRDSLRQYLGELLWLQAAIGVTCILILGTGAMVIHALGRGRELVPALLGVSFASPCVLLLWFARRALYLEYRASLAAAGATLYSTILFAAMWGLYHTGFLSTLSAFVIMGIAALATSTYLLTWLRPVLKPSRLGSELSVRSEHWRYGRWALTSSIFIWIPWNLYYPVLASFSGLAAAGTLRALMNLALPMTQLYAAFALLFLPHTARVAQVEGWAGARRQGYIIGGIFTLGSVAYWAPVLLWSRPLVAFLYHGNYANTTTYLPWLAVASILAGTTFGPMCAFRAMHSPSTVCLIYFISSTVGVALGVPAARAYGLSGALFGLVLSSVLTVLVGTFMLGRSTRHLTIPELQPQNEIA
jgi:O-antigen/teichoic acid export membrane protein/thymidylate kinase